MDQITTLNQIIKIFEHIAQQHYQINDFFVGKNWELQDEANGLKMPVLQVYPSTARIQKSSNSNQFSTAEFSISLKIWDLLRKDEQNKTEIYSDTFQILQDVVTLLSTHQYFKDNFCILSNSIIEAIAESEKVAINVIGWSTVITIKVKNWGSVCTIPIEWTTDIF